MGDEKPRLAALNGLEPGAAGPFGGKAAGLARLLAAGARVPDGFAVEATTRAPGAWSSEAREALRERGEALLARGPVAVRSSALGEDSAERSFAGLFETVLEVTTSGALEQAAERCIRSGAAERVRVYRGDAEPVPVGLVVQTQIAARAAGVCFSADPTGADGAVIVEAVAGPGEALVSGHAPPERWRVYRSGLGTWEPRRDPASASHVLTEPEAIAVASGAAGFADGAGAPLDTEWAIDAEGRLWWLQARPITSHTPAHEWVVERWFEHVEDGPITVWANWNVRETMPDPFVPLNWSLWRDVVLPVVLDDIFGVDPGSPLFPYLAAVDLVHGRLYWNMNAVLAGPLGRLFGFALPRIDARAGSLARQLRNEGVLRPRPLPRRSGMRVALARASLRSARRLARALRPRRALAALEALGRRLGRAPDPRALEEPELERELTLIAAPETEPLRRAQQLLVASFFAQAAAEHAFRREPDARALLGAGIRGNPTTEISLGIDALVEAARPLRAVFEAEPDDDTLRRRLAERPGGAHWLEELDTFLARFGQRCPREFDISAPRWVEEPGMILALVRSGLTAPAAASATARLAEMGERRGRAMAAAVAAAPAWRRPWLRAMARLVELYAPLREAPKHTAMFVFLRMRRAALELGRRRVAEGRLERPEDAFFLTRQELLLRDPAPSAELRRRVTERRARHARFLAERAPDFVRSDGVPVGDGDAPEDEGGVLRGTGIGGGAGAGAVRILTAPDPTALREGDVLVVEYADPGWTPLFPRVRAVVMEVGGVMCHAAVVARELGVPAVFGVTGATRRLEEGERVRVDGTRGTVAREP